VPWVGHNLLHLTLYVTQLIIKEVRSAQRHVTTSYLSGYESTFSPTHNNVCMRIPSTYICYHYTAIPHQINCHFHLGGYPVLSSSSATGILFGLSEVS
jgi:hypothetical protein